MNAEPILNYLQQITKEELEESRSFSGQYSQNQEQAYLSRDDIEEDRVSPTPIEFNRETPLDCTTPADSDDSYLEIVYLPFRTEKRLETVAEHAEDRRLESFGLEEDVDENALRRAMPTSLEYQDELHSAQIEPPLFKMSDILEAQQEPVRTFEQEEMMECCSCDTQCPKYCLLF